ncbi:MAG: hypothetical protein NWE93_08510 [Candidatus Bathyarchaeota archaeon]|nr:hypothetical protein [Candidatus Bathyarchaeota archaeon]
MGFLKKLTDKVTVPDGNLQLRLDSWAVPVGQSLTGSLAFSAEEDFACTEVRLEVECVETAQVIRSVYDANLRRSIPHQTTESAVLLSLRPTLHGPAHFARGENRSFPVNLLIPPASRLTFSGIGQSLVWKIKAVVAVDGRPDLATDTFEFQVVAPPPVASQPQIIKEVIVKIPCRYCQTLFNQLDTFCPNCGAKRTA